MGNRIITAKIAINSFSLAPTTNKQDAIKVYLFISLVLLSMVLLFVVYGELLV